MTFFPDCSLSLPARLLAAALGCAVSAAPVLAQTDPDPVLATVNGQPIHLSDVKAATDSLPPQARSMPPQQLYPMLLEQLIDARALLIQAQKHRPRQGPRRSARHAGGAGPGAGIGIAQQSGSPAGDR